MRSLVRYTTAVCAASMVLLTACSSETAAPTSPDLAAQQLNYAITPSMTGWTKQPADPIPTNSVQVVISGLIAVGGYPQFGTMAYSGGPGNWLDMTTAPNLSRSPLGWIFTFRLKPVAASLPIGIYTATIPVMVGGAANNPQSIVVTFNNCGNCLFVGDIRDGELTSADPRWDWDEDYNNDGDYPYDDWRVFVPAFTTVSIIVEGEDCVGPPYTHEDNTLTVWEMPGFLNGETDDDGYCDNDPIVVVTNSTGAQREYLARASSYDEAFDGSRDFGTYRIRVVLGDAGDDDLKAEDWTTPTVKRVFTRTR